MTNLHIFNPEHDLALAAGKGCYTPPTAAQRLRRGLEFIPAFWADDGDLVIVEDSGRAEDASRPFRAFMAHVRWTTWRELERMVRNGQLPSLHIQPWGWDAPLCRSLMKAGIELEPHPNARRLDRIRLLSGRATAVKALEKVTNDIPQTVGRAVVIHQADAVASLQAEWGSVVLKSPWSCSGRGVKMLASHPSPKQPSYLQASSPYNWAVKVIARQGYMTVEKYLDKVVDFGMEFTASEDGTVAYRGLSLFGTLQGCYTGNVIASDDLILSRLTRYVPAQLLEGVKSWFCQWLPPIVRGSYSGPIGVDMMVVRAGDGFAVNPCVEINLRRTMGHVAIALFARMQTPANFSIDNYQLSIRK